MQDFLIPFILTNAIGIILLLLALKWKKQVRIAFGVIFIAAGLFNFWQSVKDPSAYATAYGETAFFSFYKNFIHGYFNQHASLIIKFIAGYQILSGILLFYKNPYYKVGMYGAICFLIGIAPLGLGSAFPSSLIMAVALFLSTSTSLTKNK